MEKIIIISANNVEVARKCLERIRDIADRGASSWDAAQVSYALQELTQVLFERSGSDERLFEPESLHQNGDIRKLYEELEFVNALSQDMNRAERCQ